GPAGDWDTDGPWPEWWARWFIRFGTTNWSPTDHVPGWVAALGTSHMPFTQLLKRPSGANPPYIIPVDNGPDNNGASYPSLGSAYKDDMLFNINGNYQNAGSGFQVPAYTSPYWALGVWGTSPGSNYHWPNTALYEYLIFGKRYLI